MPLLGAVVDDLRAWRSASPATATGDLVFAAVSGGLWSGNDWRIWARRTFNTLAKGVGCASARPYDLRHSFIMRLILVGKTVPEVAALAGHEPGVTASIYLGAYRHHEQMDIQRDEDLAEHVQRARAAATDAVEGEPRLFA